MRLKLCQKIINKIRGKNRGSDVHNVVSYEDLAEKTKREWGAHESVCYERFKNSDLVKNLSEKSLCVDCGANVGNVAEIFASKGAEVYAFEPHPVCFAELEQKFSQNPKVHAINQGVMDKNSKMKLYRSEFNSYDEKFFSQSSSVFSTKDNVNTVVYDEIEVIDLCEFIENLGREVDILKLDVEGAEFCILEKLINQNLHTKIKNILVETHDETIPEIRKTAQRVRDLINVGKITNIDLNWC